VGCGEGLPSVRFGETVESELAKISEVRSHVESGIDRVELLTLMPASAARNAVDCALWDLEAKRRGRRAWHLAGLSKLNPVVTAHSIGLGMPSEVADEAKRLARYPFLKVKVSDKRTVECIASVRALAPEARIIVDANESWNRHIYERVLSDLVSLGVKMIEQPFPASDDSALDALPRPIPVFADEACCTARGIEALRYRYDGINIKLDKAGGLTEALNMVRAANEYGLGIMTGCRGGSSLGAAPAMIVAQFSKFVDLDQMMLLASDREHGITSADGLLSQPDISLWG
jgi:L-alanine-DL-glutamate epimerase-like enolase superfamily enzyme